MNMTQVFAGAIAIILCSTAWSEPHRPENDHEVLLTLARAQDDSAAMHRLRRQLADAPNDEHAAQQLTWLYLQQASASGDARFVSYAQGVLSPWWPDRAASPSILVARAGVKQALHDFAPAVRDLSDALESDPANIQARLMRASIYQVGGYFQEASRDCNRLFRTAPPHLTFTCLAGSAFTAAEVQKARRLLRRLADSVDGASAEERIWMHLVSADLASRDGYRSAALAELEQGMEVDPDRPALQAAYCDVLIDRGRYQDVIDRYESSSRDLGVLVRVAIAQTRLHGATNPNLEDKLDRAFNNATRRGDGRHYREEAMFRLHAQRDGATALQLAKENWRLQKESIDRRLLLEAALLQSKPDAAQPVIGLLENGLKDESLPTIASPRTSNL